MTEYTQDEQSEKVIDATRKWIETVVVGLNLCPFAKSEFLHERIRYSYTDANSIDALLNVLASEFSLLNEQSGVSTSVLIHPHVLTDFNEYNQFLDLVDRLLDESGYTGVFQVASFHPDYCFADSEETDAENYTNRSPYPMLHVLREAQLEQAISEYDQVEKIPVRNIELLQQLGLPEMRERLQACQD